MSDETPSEREERLQRQEERLQKAHERRSNPTPKSGGGGGTLGNIGTFFSEHKIGMVVGIAAAIVLYIFWKNSTGSSGASNQSPNFPAATGSGNIPTDLQTALDQLTQQYNTIENQLAGMGNSSGSGSTGGTGGSGGSGGSGGGGSGNGNPPGNNPATAAFNTEPSLLPAGWTITSQNGHWIANNPDQSTGPGKLPFIDLTALFPGIKVSAGGGGRMWYQLPGWQNQQSLTAPGATGTFINQLGNGNFVDPTTSNPPPGILPPSVPGGGEQPNISNYSIANSNVAKSTFVRS